MSKRNSATILLGVGVVLAIALAVFLQTNSRSAAKLRVGDELITVEVADSRSEIEKGLSARDNLGENSGMYFVLGERKIVEFWMKDMRFPLDIIWIDSGKIVGFVENAPIPNASNIPTFTSPQAVTNVLEVNAGFVKKNSIRQGDRVYNQN